MLVVFPTMECLLSDSDRDFIVSILGTSAQQRSGLERVLADPEAIDIILDNCSLQEAQVARVHQVQAISPLDFYVLVRPALLRAGLEDRDLARYVAALLSSYAYAERTPNTLPQHTFDVQHLRKLVQSLRTTNLEGRFMVYSYLGNYALLMGGLFPERLPPPTDGRDSIAYCDHLGASSYASAAAQRLAWEFNVDNTFQLIAQDFRHVRSALNELAEHQLFAPPQMERLILDPRLLQDLDKQE